MLEAHPGELCKNSGLLRNIHSQAISLFAPYLCCTDLSVSDTGDFLDKK